MTDIQVECYAGYRGDEEPRVLVRDGHRLPVLVILRRWRDTNGRGFRVRCVDGCEYEIFYDEAAGSWFELGRA
ncbi:MAG TPA: hypothetical protein PLP42_11315 [Acidobacteriota bacterium]|jgi:hypothetical protein|nr:hypothetical protein [Acidobacteriota bacterium]